MVLEIPVRGAERLPDPVQVGLSVSHARHRRLAGHARGEGDQHKRHATPRHRSSRCSMNFRLTIAPSSPCRDCAARCLRAPQRYPTRVDRPPAPPDHFSVGPDRPRVPDDPTNSQHYAPSGFQPRVSPSPSRRGYAPCQRPIIDPIGGNTTGKLERERRAATDTPLRGTLQRSDRRHRDERGI